MPFLFFLFFFKKKTFLSLLNKSLLFSSGIVEISSCTLINLLVLLPFILYLKKGERERAAVNAISGSW